MKYRTKSAEALNEADRFQRILDWQLFCNSQEQLLFGYNPDINWTPGDPIYKHPGIRSSRYSSEWEQYGGFDANSILGNCVRPILQTIEYWEDDLGNWHGNRQERCHTYPTMKCEPCGVSWGPDEDSCWMCGEIYERSSLLIKGTMFDGHTELTLPLSFVRSELREDGLFVTMEFNGEQFERQARVNQEQLRALWDAMSQPMEHFSLGLQRAGRAMNEFGNHIHGTMRGMRSQFAIYDEMRHYSIADVQATQQIWNHCHVHEYQSPVNPFVDEREPIELVPPVVPNLPPAVIWGRVVLPPNLDLSGRREPERPQMREVQLPEVYDPYWVRMGPNDPWRNR